MAGKKGVFELIKASSFKRAVLSLAMSMLGVTVLAGNVSGGSAPGHEISEHDSGCDSGYEIVGEFSLRSGDASLEIWKLPPAPGSIKPKLNTDKDDADALVELGRKLFFDKRLSVNKDRSCAFCHRPELGWSDGRATAEGLEGQALGRATPSLINAAYGTIFMWDGRAASLEQQATQPVFSVDEMGLEPEELRARLREDSVYREVFAKLFPDQEIDVAAVSTAIAAFERTIIVNDTRFDQWIDGDATAMTPAEVRGFGVFLDPDRGSCSTCHAAPNFTDQGFHNIGLESPSDANPDLGRYNIRPVKLMRGAFKTPSLRNIALTAPYFHDGSAESLMDVVEHYMEGGDTENLSPEMKDIELSRQEINDLIAFLHAISETPENSQQNSLSVATE